MNSNRVATTIKLLYRCVPMFFSLALTLSLLSIVSVVCYYTKIKNRLNKPNQTKPKQNRRDWRTFAYRILHYERSRGGYFLWRRSFTGYERSVYRQQRQRYIR